MKYFFIVLFGGIVLFTLFYKFIFLRDNKNNVPLGKNIISPASGKIVSIQEVSKNSNIEIRKGFFGKINTELDRDETYYLINIFMSPLDVHIQKMPMDAKIIEITQTNGKFLPVNTLQAGLVNEKQEFLMETEVGRIKVIQIAGFLARRTRSWVKEGDELKKGDKFGIILLGSQVAILFPKKQCDLTVKVGDRVESGETVLGKFKIES